MTDVSVDVAGLAKLARLEVSETELETLKKQLPDILAFVHTIESVSAEVPDAEPALQNVMRDDANPHESGVFTKRLMDAAPKSRNDLVVVKQVVTRKKQNGAD